MSHDLEIAIENAELADERAQDFEDAICALTERQYTILILLDAFKKAVLDSELQWRELEQRVDFRAKYRTREHAHQIFQRRKR